MRWYDKRTITASLTPVEAIDRIDSLVARARELSEELGVEAGRIKAQWESLKKSGGGRDDHAAALLDNLRPKLAEIATFSDNCATQIKGWSANPFGKTARKAGLEIEDITEEGLSVERDVSAKDVDQDELEMGIKVEHEHTDKDELAEKISLDHLAEIPDYYTRLKEMEERADAEGKKAAVLVQVRTADFQPPKPGKPQMASITWRNPSATTDPYYLISDVNSGKDARGNTTWDARVRGRDGAPRTIHSSDVQSWRPYSGKPYEWHEQEISLEQGREQERSMKSEVEGFRATHKFQDGRPVVPNMFLTVNPSAAGDLGMFAGRRLRVESVDHKAGTVSLKPFGWEEPEFEQFLKSIPASDVIAGTAPSMARAVEATPVRLQNGQVVTERDLPAMTPNFGLALENGQVTATVRVFGNYESKDVTGEQRYLRDMAERGYEPGEGGYALDTTPKSHDPPNLFGPYSANVRIAPPISQELIEEIRTLAPASQVRGNAKNGLVIDSKPLFMLMVDSGHQDKVGRKAAEDVVAWVERNLKFASSTESTNPEWFG